jgi:hypothetical protein
MKKIASGNAGVVHLAIVHGKNHCLGVDHVVFGGDFHGVRAQEKKTDTLWSQ